MSMIRRFPDRRGFTLVELLVALMISSFLVTVIYQLMSGNSRFVRIQSAREEVQQNARAAIDVMASDLRTVPPSAIRAMGPDSIRFYMPRAFGVLCNAIDATSPTVWAVFPAGVLSSTDVFAKPHWGIAVEQTADPLVHTDALRFVTGPTQQTAGNACTGTPTSLQPAIVAGQQVALGFNRPTGSSYVTAGTILPGTQVVLFEEMKYDVAPSSSSAVPGSWIRRMVGRNETGANMQPMAGPVPGSGALRFAYFRADGVTAATTPADVRRIGIRVITQSRAQAGAAGNRRAEQMDTVSTDVYLRNVSNQEPPMRHPIRCPARDERGVALPLALLGLVTVSLLVTTALVTSSTELAISDAHQDATEGLYSAEGGLQAYVAERGTIAQNDAGQGEFDFTPAAGGPPVRLGVVQLGRQVLPNRTTMRLYSVLARPAANGGRTVSAVLTQIVPAPVPPDLNITSAMTVAGDLSVSGNSFDVSGRSTACGSTGVDALRLASDSELSFANGNQYETRVQRFVGVTDAGANSSGDAAIERGGSRTSLVNSLLGGRSIDDLAAAVPTTNWRYRTRTPTYSSAWLATALQAPGSAVVVDAQGGTIAINPGTYYGLLIVVNGSVSISGNIDFNGIILAETNFSLAGNVTITGAIASMAMDGENVVSNAGDDSDLDGTVAVNYNKCMVDSALQAYAGVTPNTQTPDVRRTVSWLEVVR